METPKLIHVDNIEGILRPDKKYYINEGRKFGTPSAFSLPISSGSEVIGDKSYTRDANSITLDARKAALIYDDELNATNALYAVDPLTFIDGNTVGFWKPNGDATCPNLAVGYNGNTLAVANDLTKTGTVTKVDGRDGGYAGKGDGSTGCYTSANYTNFPIGASEREMNILMSPNAICPSSNYIFSGYGAIAAGSTFDFRFAANNNLVASNSSSDWATGYNADSIGKLYFFSLKYDGTTLKVLVNGQVIFSQTTTLATAAGIMYLYRYSAANPYISPVTIHFVELRNKCRTDQQTAEMAAKLLFPVCWDTHSQNLLTGSAIGTLTGGGGLSASFNGISSKAYTACSYIGATPAITGYIGRAWDIARDIESVVVTGSSDYGLSTDVTINQLTINVQGSNDNFATFTTLKSVSVADSNGISLSINNIPRNSFLAHRLELIEIGTAGSTSHCLSVAEVRFNERTTGRKSIRSLLSDKAILGYVETSSNGVTLVNDADWGYGRREKATCGNRSKWLSPIFFNGDTILSWDNPFKTLRTNVKYFYSKTSDMTNIVPVDMTPYASGYYGVGTFQTFPSIKARVRAIIDATTTSYSSISSGYICAFAECLEDDEV